MKKKTLWFALLWCGAILAAGCPEPRREAGAIETIAIADGVALSMVWCPAGSFRMGSPETELDRDSNETAHKVTLTSGFWLGQFEVTKEQWYTVMGTTPWFGQEEVIYDSDSPATYLSWNDAQAFVRTLREMTGLNFSLPTEAQWEYACRAGTSTRFYWGDDLDYADMDAHAWYFDNAEDIGEDYAHAAGQKTPNAWGLYDTTGNVSEWCQDWYQSDLGENQENNPDGPSSGTDKLQRGGSWSSFANNCRAANRTHKEPNLANTRYGLRILRLE